MAEEVEGSAGAIARDLVDLMVVCVMTEKQNVHFVEGLVWRQYGRGASSIGEGQRLARLCQHNLKKNSKEGR